MHGRWARWLVLSLILWLLGPRRLGGRWCRRRLLLCAWLGWFFELR